MKSSKSFIRKFFGRLLATIGALTVLGVIIIVVLVVANKPTDKSIPNRVILEANFEKGLVEYMPDDPFAQLIRHDVTTVRDIVDALKRAAKDERVVGLVARVGAAPMGLAVIQEIRDAVKAFTQNGKFAVAYAETFGEFGPGDGAYYLATAFDEIYLQPSGDLCLTGLVYESPFFRGTLDKLHIEPRMDHRKEYKNALNALTEKEYSIPHREAMEKLMNSQFSQIVQGIVESRGLTEEELQTIIDDAPLLGDKAVEVKLVDGLLYRDEVFEIVKAKAEGAKLLYLNSYLRKAGRLEKEGPTIALIYGVGGVHRGASEYNTLSGSSSMGSDTISAAFREAVADDDVKAILFRVNSPGGSYIASDTIWREIVKAEKPVIVSMGNVAGSGGYFVAMAANKIVAQPGTITGSIGVLTGKMLTRKFWEEYTGITWDSVQTNKNAAMWTGTHDYSPEQWQKVQDFLDRCYKDFTTKVAQGRKMELEKVLEVAKGRIWTGADAKKLGLVDELGGFDVALRLARTEAGLEPDAKIKVAVYPRPKRFIDRLMKRGANNSEPGAEIVAIRQMLHTVRPLYNMARQAGLIEDNNVLQMPLFEQNW